MFGIYSVKKIDFIHAYYLKPNLVKLSHLSNFRTKYLTLEMNLQMTWFDIDQVHS
jgi:hypothetical protein